jgi:hypothetical protein
MPCGYKYQDLCPTNKRYIGSGNPYYHGELCDGCGFWEDSPEDIAFRERQERLKIAARRYRINQDRRLGIVRDYGYFG